MKDRAGAASWPALADESGSASYSTLTQSSGSLRTQSTREVDKELWIGTSCLFRELLRFDIDKYKDPKG